MNRFFKLFLPHRENDFTPDLLQKIALLAMTGLVVLSFTSSNLLALFWQQSDWLVAAVLPAVIVDETNVERDENALVGLIRNPKLDAAATKKAQHMASESYFAHYSPEGVSPWHWFDEVGYVFAHAGENLAVHFSDSHEVVEAWMKSPTHRANIINSNFTEIGVGTAKGRFEGRDTVFVVQLFGTPAKREENVAYPAVAIAESKSIDSNVVPEDESVAGASIDPVEVETVSLIDQDSNVENLLPIKPVSENTQNHVQSLALAEELDIVNKNSFVATSSGLPPADPSTVDHQNTEISTLGLATSPSRLLQLTYLVVGLLVIIALIASVTFEWRNHRPRQVIYGVLLLILMCLLFIVHVKVVGGVLVL